MTESQAKVTRCGRVRTALSWSSYKRRRIEREFDTLALQIGLRNKVLEESRGKIVALVSQRCCATGADSVPACRGRSVR